MPMRLELKDIKGGVLEQGYSCSLADFPELLAIAQQDGPQYKEPLEFYLRFQRTGSLVEVDGRVDAVVRLRCGRCLQIFESSISETFALTFTPQSQETEEEDLELEVEQLGLITYQDETLELREPLQEQLLLAIPISPVCDSKCLGLCPHCGVNLNECQCSCVRKPFNNKFSVLADIALKKD
ncbi:MAG: DUF177 domain-containing protein [Deltaproteobacteria bacterium]|nr:DUF177 domain-containing protein [Deltaproteobacteria bacterium]